MALEVGGSSPLGHPQHVDQGLSPGAPDSRLLGQNYHLLRHVWNTIAWFRYQRAFDAARAELEAMGAREVVDLAVAGGRRPARPEEVPELLWGGENP